VVVITRRRGRRVRSGAVLIAIAAVGGFGLTAEILGLLVFQATLGYLYHALGVLIAAFMAGLAMGAAVVSGRRVDQVAAARFLIAGLLTSALIAALLPGLLRAIVSAATIASLVIGLLLASVGSLVGALFPIAVALYRREMPVAAAGGAVYAADLVGSAGAAVFAGALAIPLLGVSGAAYFMALLLAAALVLAMPMLRPVG
jgi:spermidine synthase